MAHQNAIRDTELRRRALKVLGADPEHEYDSSRLRHAFHCRMLRHHPDRSHAPDAERCAALVNEAFALLTGKLVPPARRGNTRQDRLLLEDDELAARVAGEPLDSVSDAPTYEQWLRQRFLDEDNHSIWPT